MGDISKHAEYRLQLTLSQAEEKKKTRLEEAKKVWNAMTAEDVKLTASRCADIIKQNSDCIAFIPHDKLTDKLCERAIKRDPSSIIFVPEEHRTEQLSTLCLDRAGRSIRATVDIGITYLLRYCKQTPLVIQHAMNAIVHAYSPIAQTYIIPAFENPTQELVREIVSLYPYEICYVPKDMINDVLTDDIVHNAMVVSKGMALSYIEDPKESWCKDAAEMLDAAKLADFDDVLRKYPETYKYAVKRACEKKDEAIRYVPKDMVTRDVCVIAAKQSFKALSYIKEELPEFFSPELVEIAVKNAPYPDARLIIPFKEYLAPETVDYMLSNCPGAIECFEEREISERMAILAVQRYYVEFDNIPLKKRTPLVCPEALKQFASMGIDKDDSFTGVKNKAFRMMVKAAVSLDGMMLGAVPYSYMTNIVIRTALKENIAAIQFVPNERQDTDMQMQAVKKDIRLLSVIQRPAEEVMRYVVGPDEAFGYVSDLIQGMSGKEILDTLDELGITA